MADGDKKNPREEPRSAGAVGERGKGRERPKSRENRSSAPARGSAQRDEGQGRKPNSEVAKSRPSSSPNSGASSGAGDERRGANRGRGNIQRNDGRRSNPEATKSGPSPSPSSGPGEDRQGANRSRANGPRNEVRRSRPEVSKYPPPGEGRHQTHSPQASELLSDDTELSEEPREPAGATFFRSVENYDQEKALESLSDLNVKLIKQANPTPGQWAYLALSEEHCPPKEAERIKRAMTLPADVYAVIVDSGFSLRVILTGTPMYERMLEFNFIAEASFDCWIQEEWMREEVYEDKYELLRHAPELLQKYLEKDIVSNEELVHAPRPGGAMPPARTEW